MRFLFSGFLVPFRVVALVLRHSQTLTLSLCSLALPRSLHLPPPPPPPHTGKAAYVDVQGWHVYLRDVKVSGAPLSGILAGELGPLAAAGQGAAALSPAAIDGFLAKVPLKLGGGKATVSLLDAIPSFALGDLHRAVEDWARNGGR